MKEKSNDTRIMNPSQRWLRKALVPFVVGFFGLVFFLLQAPHAANAHTNAQFRAGGIMDAPVAQPVADFSFLRTQPAHMPLQSFPVQAEVEVTDERETDDDSNESSINLLAEFHTETMYLYSAPQDLIPGLHRSIKNRSTVCLFVLHHSWKSFLI